MKKIFFFVLLAFIANQTFTGPDADKHPSEIIIPTQRPKITDQRAVQVLDALIAALTLKREVSIRSEVLPFLKRIEISELDPTTGSYRNILSLEKQFDQASYARGEVFNRVSVFDQCGFINPDDISAYIRENSKDIKPEELKEFLEIIHALKAGRFPTTDKSQKAPVKIPTKK